MNAKNYIEINNLCLRCRLGVSEEEISYAQKIFINCKIFADFKIPMESDNISDSIDYVYIISEIEKLIVDRSFCLIEHLANEIRKILFKNPKVKKVKIKIIKPSATANTAYVSFNLNARKLNHRHVG